MSCRTGKVDRVIAVFVRSIGAFHVHRNQVSFFPALRNMPFQLLLKTGRGLYLQCKIAKAKKGKL